MKSLFHKDRVTQLYIFAKDNFRFVNRRQGIEEALKHVDDTCETVFNSMKEYVAMRQTLKSIVQEVPVGLV